jgi:hypothetical protein
MSAKAPNSRSQRADAVPPLQFVPQGRLARAPFSTDPAFSPGSPPATPGFVQDRSSGTRLGSHRFLRPRLAQRCGASSGLADTRRRAHGRPTLPSAPKDQRGPRVGTASGDPRPIGWRLPHHRGRLRDQRTAGRRITPVEPPTTAVSTRLDPGTGAALARQPPSGAVSRRHLTDRTPAAGRWIEPPGPGSGAQPGHPRGLLPDPNPGSAPAAEPSDRAS